MKTLDLMYPERSDVTFKKIVFPDGQPHLKIDVASAKVINKKQPLKIITRLASANDLLLLLFAKNALDYMEFAHIELDITYLMTARMDRVMLEGEPFSLKVVAAMLNQAAFKKINIFDPHSEVSMALIDRSYTITNHDFVKDAMDNYLKKHKTGKYSIVSPDAGAVKKIYKLAQELNIDNVVECTKERDPKTGELTNFKTTADNISGQTCFIIDDICDGGSTFAGTAKMLKEKGAKKVVLIVSHGIFSKGTAIENIDDIYTTSSYREVPGVSCLAIEQYLED